MNWQLEISEVKLYLQWGGFYRTFAAKLGQVLLID